MENVREACNLWCCPAVLKVSSFASVLDDVPVAERKLSTFPTGPNMLSIPAKRYRKEQGCYAMQKGIYLWKLYIVCIKASLRPVLDIVFQYGDAVAPLPLTSYEDCKTKPLQLPQIFNMIRLHSHLSKDLVGLPSRN